MYDADVLKQSGKVSLELKNVDLRDALQRLITGKALDYKIIDRTVIISEARANTSQEEILIKGTVKSKDGTGQSDMALPGVVITIKGTKRPWQLMAMGPILSWRRPMVRLSSL